LRTCTRPDYRRQAQNGAAIPAGEGRRVKISVWNIKE
jgi:hypothetical protein